MKKDFKRSGDARGQDRLNKTPKQALILGGNDNTAWLTREEKPNEIKERVEVGRTGKRERERRGKEEEEKERVRRGAGNDVSVLTDELFV